jgi:hypothetical protein
MKRIAKKIAGSYEPKNYYLRDLLLSLYNGKSVSLSEVGGLDLNLRVDLSTVIHCFGRGGFDRRKVRDILVAAASSDPAWLLSGPQISYALGDSQTFEHDLQLVNGDRVHGRLTMNDVEAALDRFGYEEVVVVGGTPEGSNPRQVVTVAILIQERGWAVGEVTAMTVAGFQQATTMQMQHVDAYYPKLIAHLGELLRDIYQP